MEIHIQYKSQQFDVASFVEVLLPFYPHTSYTIISFCDAVFVGWYTITYFWAIQKKPRTSGEAIISHCRITRCNCIHPWMPDERHVEHPVHLITKTLYFLSTPPPPPTLLRGDLPNLSGATLSLFCVFSDISYENCRCQCLSLVAAISLFLLRFPRFFNNKRKLTTR